MTHNTIYAGDVLQFLRTLPDGCAPLITGLGGVHRADLESRPCGRCQRDVTAEGGLAESMRTAVSGARRAA